MGKQAKKQVAAAFSPVVVDVLSKKDAAHHISLGVQHVHCSELGKKDPIYVATLSAIGRGVVPRFLWEPSTKVEEWTVKGSADRPEFISKLLASAKVEVKRQLREKLVLVLEELLTNALFHAFRADGGKEKYSRKQNVQLISTEGVKVRFAATEDGCFVEVQDTGGSLAFESIAESLKRCYESESQIQAKESGAGLGIYMIFETASHVKICNEPGKRTVISCWIADRRTENPKSFSFNYFGGRRK